MEIYPYVRSQVEVSYPLYDEQMSVVHLGGKSLRCLKQINLGMVK